MRTLFGRLKKKTKSGQAAKANTGRQLSTLKNFQFLEAHLTIQMDTRLLGRVLVPALAVNLEEEEEGGDDDDDATSLMSGRSSSQLPSTQQPSTSQAGPSQPPCDRRPMALSSTSSLVFMKSLRSLLAICDAHEINAAWFSILTTSLQKVPTYPTIFLQLSPTIPRRSPPISDQHQPSYDKSLPIPPICTDCCPLVIRPVLE